MRAYRVGGIVHNPTGSDGDGHSGDGIDNGFVLRDPCGYPIPNGGICGQLDGDACGGRWEDGRLLLGSHPVLCIFEQVSSLECRPRTANRMTTRKAGERCDQGSRSRSVEVAKEEPEERRSEYSK